MRGRGAEEWARGWLRNCERERLRAIQKEEEEEDEGVVENWEEVKLLQRKKHLID
ncbi:unnamed protein product [Dovyalis caffra]|uniref:Uncharacterized protein n=1 Tax=Dovyalis caffra TaxID=77055 RepID=A0AAV1RFQ5_9ROSI|nr:unnamed protein product [Dovyalis caffra]